jgi:hypothetical protein
MTDSRINMADCSNRAAGMTSFDPVKNNHEQRWSSQRQQI